MTNDDFLGRTIDGEVSHYSDGIADQADPKEFLAALDALLATPGVEAVRWQQYTPYFNDGEACTFHTGEAQVKIAFDDESYDGDYGQGFRTSYEFYSYPTGDWRNAVPLEIEGVDVNGIKDALGVFERELTSKHYVILNQKFGDPATVTAHKAGHFTVEFYEHD